jgi:hypothetical protein
MPLFPDNIAADLIRYGVVRVPRYRKPKGVDTVQLYLVEAEVNEVSFKKIGLTALADPLARDREAYKSLVKSVHLPVDPAGAIEAVALGLCTGRHRNDEHAAALEWIKGWAGAGEAVFTDQDITPTFDEAIELCAGYSYEELTAELESLWYLQSSVVRIYGEPKRLPPRVKALRKLLGLEELKAREQWRMANGWAV